MTGNITNLDLVNINAHTKFGENLSICFKDIEQKRNSELLISVKGHNSITNLRKMTGNNPNLDLVSINAYTKFGKIQLIYSLYIKQKVQSSHCH